MPDRLQPLVIGDLEIPIPIVQGGMGVMVSTAALAGAVAECGAAGTIAGVDGVEKCFVRKMGYQFFVDMHVEVDPQMTVERSHRIGHEVKNRVRSEIPSVRDVLIHIEPLNLPADKARP